MAVTEIGKEFGWTGPGKYESRNGTVWYVAISGREDRPFVGIIADSHGTDSWRANGGNSVVEGFIGHNDLIRPHVPPREKVRGWVNRYKDFDVFYRSRAEADRGPVTDRIACVYVEETTPPEGGE